MNSGCRRKRKKRSRLPCSHTKPGTTGRRMYRRPRERSERRCWGKFRMRESRTSDLGPRTSDLGLQTSDCRPQTSDLHGRGPKSEVRRRLVVALLSFAILPLLSCSAKPDSNTLVMVIESSPMNLDPRVGIDAFSERIDNLIFDDLLSRDEDLNVAPGLAERWEIPDPLTYIFHLHRGVKFH